MVYKHVLGTVGKVAPRRLPFRVAAAVLVRLAITKLIRAEM